MLRSDQGDCLLSIPQPLVKILRNKTFQGVKEGILCRILVLPGMWCIASEWNFIVSKKRVFSSIIAA